MPYKHIVLMLMVDKQKTVILCKLYRVFLNSVHTIEDIVPWVQRNVKFPKTMGLLSCKENS